MPLQKWAFAFVFTLSIAYVQGGTDWPYQDFAYAKIYAYNFDDSLEHQHQLVKDDALDPSVIGEGHRLNDDQQGQLIALLNGDVGLLLEGLSKCYLPHHGVVLYDEDDQIVASATFCFLCDAIRMYPEPKSYSTKHSRRKVEKAELLMLELKNWARKTGVPVYDHPKDYHDHYSAYKDSAKKEFNIEKEGIVRELLGMKSPFYRDLKAIWADSSSLVLERAVKYSAGGDKYYFLHVKDNTNEGVFWTSKEGNELSVLRVRDPGTHLKADIRVGMNTLYLMNFLGLEERPEFGIVNVFDPEANGNVIFRIDRGRVIGIDIEVI